MNQTKMIQSCKLDYCPNCHRKLCRRKEISGTEYVEFRHKGSEIYAIELILTCVGCKRQFIINSDKGIVDEVNFGKSTN